MADLNGKTGNVIRGLTLANLGIAGPKGEDGVGVASITMNAEYELIITLTNGNVYTSPVLKGPKGDSVEYDDSELRAEINDRYTKEEVDNMISVIPKFAIAVVETLPISDISTTTVYLVPNNSGETSNLYDEYIYTTQWEKLGTQTVDLSDYPTTSEMNAAIDAAINSIIDGDEVEF